MDVWMGLSNPVQEEVALNNCLTAWILLAVELPVQVEILERGIVDNHKFLIYQMSLYGALLPFYQQSIFELLSLDHTAETLPVSFTFEQVPT